jgi:hypothetical protein
VGPRIQRRFDPQTLLNVMTFAISLSSLSLTDS